MHIANKVGNYQVEKTLGSGTFSTVKLGVHRVTGERVALKMVNQLGTAFDREVEIMKQLSHPNIVQIKEVIPITENNTSCIVMEYVAGGNLLNCIIEEGPIPEQQAAKFLRQILSALAYCHNRLIVHRDLKCENILLDASHRNIKLADFGLSRRMDPGRFLNSRCGSPHYMAPELLQKHYIGPEVDIFSLGVILYAMVSGCFPWEGETLTEQLSHLQAGEYVPLRKASAGCAYVVDRMLNPDPKKRATISELFAHPWVNPDNMDASSTCEEMTGKPFPVESIDEEIVSQLEHLSFSREEVTDNLKNPLAKHEFSVCLYFLLLEDKEKRTKGEVTPVTSSISLRDIGGDPSVPCSPQVRRITRKQLSKQTFSITTNDESQTSLRTRKLQERIEHMLKELHVEFKIKEEAGSWKKRKAIVYSCKNTVVTSLFELEIFDVVDEERSQKAVVPKFLGGDMRIYNIIMSHLNVSLAQ